MTLTLRAGAVLNRLAAFRPLPRACRPLAPCAVSRPLSGAGLRQTRGAGALLALMLVLSMVSSLASAGSPVATVAEQPFLHDLAAAVSPDELHATVTQLVAFGTRHTLSDTRSPSRGIGAARRWVEGRFQALSGDCGQCLEIVTPARQVSGDRIPRPTEVMDVVAIQRGTADPNRVILITGHLDSRNSGEQDASGDAPGANDDGSGTAAVLEAARVLSRHRFRATLVYGVLSGEEQGLYGGKILADYAKAQGWQVEADLNNDIVGNIHGVDGVVDNSTVRIFSEGTKAVETPDQAKTRRYNGGEVDSPSRNVARFMAGIAEVYVPNLTVRMVYRTDRYGRGGDQVEFLALGFPAVRVTEGHENYTRQHQDLRVEGDIAYGDVLGGVDFPYLAQVTRLNVVTLAAMANAPAPPTGLTIAGAVSPDTVLAWKPSPGAAAYRAWWRDTTAARWQFSRAAPAPADGQPRVVLPAIVIDDWFFGVSAISADGYESPVVFPGAPGAF